jgi:hypothetical protein
LLEILGVASPQYTDRWKKTLMLSCKCLLCWNIRDYRKTRVVNGLTKSCWCWRKAVFSKWDRLFGFTYLAEAPNSVLGGRRLYVSCLCWDKEFLDILAWYNKKDCWCWKYKNLLT